MKVGDLVKWHRDGDIGIVLGFVQDDVSGGYLGNPIIKWYVAGLTHSVNGIDDSIEIGDEDLEVISECR